LNLSYSTNNRPPWSYSTILPSSHSSPIFLVSIFVSNSQHGSTVPLTKDYAVDLYNTWYSILLEISFNIFLVHFIDLHQQLILLLLHCFQLILIIDNLPFQHIVLTIIENIQTLIFIQPTVIDIALIMLLIYQIYQTTIHILHSLLIIGYIQIVINIHEWIILSNLFLYLLYPKFIILLKINVLLIQPLYFLFIVYLQLLNLLNVSILQLQILLPTFLPIQIQLLNPILVLFLFLNLLLNLSLITFNLHRIVFNSYQSFIDFIN